MADPVQGISRNDSAGAVSPTSTSSSTLIAPPGIVSGGSSSDLTDVSKTEGLLQVMGQAAADVPVVDEARVGALRDAIASGTFQPDPQRIAQRMVQWEAALAGDANEP
jgi:negative regulator of flagellin synthesis FlgM